MTSKPPEVEAAWLWAMFSKVVQKYRMGSQGFYLLFGIYLLFGEKSAGVTTKVRMIQVKPTAPAKWS